MPTSPSRQRPRKGRHITVAANGVGVLHSDKLDLQTATSRKRFTGATMQVAYKDVPADDWPADVRAALEKQLLDLARVPARRRFNSDCRHIR